MKMVMMVYSRTVFHFQWRAVSESPSHWGAARSAVSEYKTYSDAQVEVFHNDQLITSTDNGVRTSQLLQKRCRLIGFAVRLIVIRHRSRSTKLSTLQHLIV